MHLKEKILIIGDLMLDRYYFGQSNRMSPEAPVPVVDVEEIRDNPGGHPMLRSTYHL